MAVLAAGLVWTGLVIWLLLRALRQFRMHLPLASPAPEDALGSVAIIVPVRNEIRNVAACLDALQRQHALPANSEIIVIDDESQDGTAQAVERFCRHDPRFRLLRPGALPSGWLGKPRGCWCGAQASTAEWLCFIDADVRAGPQLVHSALAAAGSERLDMLSLTPFQLLGSFCERLIIPAGLLLIACVVNLRRRADPSTDEVAVNGQCLLIRRSAYFALGGHAAVRHEVCEDKALALRAKQAGWRYGMRDAGRLAETRMYADAAGLWSGFSKNAVDIIGNSGGTIAVAVSGCVLGWAAWLVPLLAGLQFAAAPTPTTAAGFALCAFGTLIVAAVHLAMARHFRIPLIYGLLFAFAYSAVAALACHSAAARRAGRVSWKGRVYDVRRTVAPEPR